MTVTVDEVERFGDLIAAGLGLRMSDRPVSVLSTVLSRRAEQRGTSTAGYLDWLAAGPEEDELGRLAGSLTVPETYFFRDPDQLRAFEELVRSLGGSGGPRILSAGCASGEEPYSLAMLLRDRGITEFSILGVDISPELITRAEEGRYSAWALRATPADKRQRWFDKDNVLSEEIRTAVRFEARNLAGPDDVRWRPAAYDVIFCRNVLMYFTADRVRAVVARLASALVPGGFLFVGPAETAHVRHLELHLRPGHRCFYYQREQPSASQACPAVRPTREPPSPAGPDPALELVRSERFADALGVVLARPEDQRTTPSALVLEAVLRAAIGDFTEAERICDALLGRDIGNADAQYVIATCCAGRADPGGAEQAAGRAVELDAYFAIPRLHLGILAARRGDRPVARRELNDALALLPWESPERILLFGGGFTVDGLSAICRSHLSACGDAS